MKLLISYLISITSCDSIFSFALTLQDEYLLVYMALRDYCNDLQERICEERGLYQTEPPNWKEKQIVQTFTFYMDSIDRFIRE